MINVAKYDTTRDETLYFKDIFIIIVRKSENSGIHSGIKLVSKPPAGKKSGNLRTGSGNFLGVPR